MKKNQRIGLLLVVFLCSFFINQNIFCQSVDIKQLTAKAQDLQSQDRMQEASKIYLTILNSYPKHEPTLINYARLLYRMDKTSEACVIFSKVNLNHLDTATSYEYGLSHFWQKKYASALTAFKRIPPGDPLSDLASYYGAICAFKLKRYTEAEFMINKAVVLPDSLQESKKNYQKYILEMKNLEEQKKLREEQQQEKRRMINEMNERRKTQEDLNTKARLEKVESKRGGTAQNIKTQPTQDNQTSSQSSKKTDILNKKVKIKTPTVNEPFFHTPKKEATLGYNFKSEGYNFFDNGSVSSYIHKAEFNFKNAPVFYVGGKVNPTVVGLQFEVGGGFSNSQGVEHRTFSYESDRDKLRIYSSFFERQDAYYDSLVRSSSDQRFYAGDETTSSTVEDESVTPPQTYTQTYEEEYEDSGLVGTIGINPWIDFPLKNLFWISLGGEADVNLRDFDFSKSASLLGGYLIFGKRFFKDEVARIYLKDKFSTILAGGSMEIYDNEASLIYEQVFLKALFLQLYTKYDYYMYAYDDTPGPASLLQVGGDFSYTFPVGFKIGLDGAFNYILDYMFASSSKDLKVLDVNVSGTSYGGRAYLGFRPSFFPWISLDLSQSYTMFSWFSEEIDQELIEKSLPDSSDCLKVALNLNLFF